MEARGRIDPVSCAHLGTDVARHRAHSGFHRWCACPWQVAGIGGWAGTVVTGCAGTPMYLTTTNTA